MIKLRILRWGSDAGFSRLTLSVITSVLEESDRGRSDYRGKGSKMTEVELGVRCFEDGGKGYKSRSTDDC